MNEQLPTGLSKARCTYDNYLYYVCLGLNANALDPRELDCHELTIHSGVNISVIHNEVQFHAF